MTNKAILIGIGILAIGLVALPQTLALFVGQHNWYDTTTSANGVPCAKCHADVVQEINTGTSQVNVYHRGQTSDGGCQACHMTVAGNSTMTAAGRENLTQGPTGSFHAAIAPACIDCHSPGGTGLSALEIQSGADEVHKPFVNQANSSSVGFLKGANEACIGCHTHVAVDITWTKRTNMSLSATEVSTPNNHSWVVGNYIATGDVIIKTNGDGNGNGAIIP